MRDRSRRSNRNTFSSSRASVGISPSPVGVELAGAVVPGRYVLPILRLWARLLPELRGRNMSEKMISDLQEWHRELCVRLFRGGISERQISRSHLDSPWIRDDERNWLIREFSATHRDVQGRI